MSSEYLTGKFFGNAKGFGFVSVEGYESDFFVSEENTGYAFHGDEVRIKPLGFDGRGRQEALVTEILAHAYDTVVGVYEKDGSYGFVIPDDRKLVHDIYIPREKSMGAVTGHKVVCRLTFYGSMNRKPEGEIAAILGHKDDPGVDILSVVYAKKIPDKFPEEVQEEARKVAKPVNGWYRRGRVDLREELTITIDGADSKDLDDAISLRKKGEDYVLGVHIADVSHYVREGSALDQEARRRGNSVYLTGTVIPMLPQILCNEICSLNPGEDRLALSCLVTLDKKARPVGFELVESVIRSDRRMTYDAVNEILEHPDGELALDPQLESIVPMLVKCEIISELLEKRRRKRGAIDFEFPESVIKLDETGVPVDIHPYERGKSQRMIESFMLCANETVAHAAFDAGLPFVYRIHGNPDADRLASLKSLAGRLGYTLNGDINKMEPKYLQQLVWQSEGEPEESLIQVLVLRSMQRAAYGTEETSHFGLAAPFYCHFTSPIRRYPDLQIHRILKEGLITNKKLRKLTKKRRAHYEKLLPGVAKSCSDLERRADEAEREVVKIKKALYMEQFLGQEFSGRVSGLTSWGIYVALPNTVEGMVPFRDMMDDHYNFDEADYVVVGERSGRTYHLGDAVSVLVARVDLETSNIDFVLAGRGWAKGSSSSYPIKGKTEKSSKKSGYLLEKPEKKKKKKKDREKKHGKKQGKK